MRNTQLLEGLEKDAKSLVEAYVDDGGCDDPGLANQWISGWEKTKLAEKLGALEVWDAEARLCVSFLFGLAESSCDYRFIRDHFRNHEEAVLNVAAEMERLPKPSDLAKAILGGYLADAKFADDPTVERPFRSAFTNYAWQHLDWSSPVQNRPDWLRALARWHPQKLVESLSQNPDSVCAIMQDTVGHEIFEETDQADDLLIAWAEKELPVSPARPSSWSSAPSGRWRAFFNVKILSSLRNDRYHDLVMRLAVMPEFAPSEHAVDVLLRYRADIVLKAVIAGYDRQTPWDFTKPHRELVALAISQITGTGVALLREILVINEFRYGWARETMKLLLHDPAHEHADLIRNLFLEHAAGLSGRKVSDFWGVIAEYDKGLFLPEWQNFAEGKSKLLRDIAAAWLLANHAEGAMEKADKLLASDVTGDRLAGVSLLGSSASAEDIERLKSLHGSEPTKQVRMAIAAVLSKHGVEVAPEPEKEVEGIDDFPAFEKRIAEKPKSIKLPKATWLSPEKLPALFTKDGAELSELARTFLFQRQAREKGVVNEEVTPMLAHLDRAKNAPFAHALLDQWFASDMKATTRWVLDVAGITGDDTIIQRLIEPIEHWCLGNNGSRAEWASHAIALLGTEKALGTLDGLIHRYRSRRKYVGAAASLAIFRTAEMMGISADELAERIVPDFGFDVDGEKDFAARNGNATAVLCHDFKVAWRDADKLAANSPEKLTEESEEELKETRKFLREAVSRQTLRLQDSMIGGKRWSLDVWRGRFEVHPLFRIFAMRLVWGVYDTDGKLMRTFRLYPNGLTADAAGGLEEFPEAAANIGIVHRMELDDKSAKEWAAHLKRFKVKPLFKQLDRPVHPLDPEHGNRKEIRLTKDVKTTAGTLRKELLGRGWSLSAAGDGGRLSGMWRRFPGSAIEAYLPVDDLCAFSGKDDELILEPAYFANGNPAKTNYVDFPSEAVAITFGNVPPVIYSETIADLQGIIPTGRPLP
jgi:hypothetical protein